MEIFSTRLQHVKEGRELCAVCGEFLAVNEFEQRLRGVPLEVDVGVRGLLDSIEEKFHRSTLLNVLICADDYEAWKI